VLPGGEVYSALDKGVIDASDWATPSMNQRMGFFQVAKHFNYPGFHSMPLGDFTVNINEWNKLPEDIKQILKSACREWCWDSVERVAVEDIRAIGELKKMGITPHAWSEEDMTRVREVVRDVWDEFGKKSPMTKKVIDSQVAWLKELGLIK
jgi:TRAP-type mannitol/chloroaromatic compound transport system substrate-binding protein